MSVIKIGKREIETARETETYVDAVGDEQERVLVTIEIRGTRGPLKLYQRQWEQLRAGGDQVFASESESEDGGASSDSEPVVHKVTYSEDA